MMYKMLKHFTVMVVKYSLSSRPLWPLKVYNIPTAAIGLNMAYCKIIINIVSLHALQYAISIYRLAKWYIVKLEEPMISDV